LTQSVTLPPLIAVLRKDWVPAAGLHRRRIRSTAGLPHDRICVTQNAVFGFHAGWRPGFLGLPKINEPATRTLMSSYPDPVRHWIARNGGLGTATIYLSGPELFAMYRQCRR